MFSYVFYCRTLSRITRRRRMKMFIGVTSSLPIHNHIHIRLFIVSIWLGKFVWEYALECAPRTTYISWLLPYQSLSREYTFLRSHLLCMFLLASTPTSRHHSEVVFLREGTRRWIISRNYVVNCWHFFSLSYSHTQCSVTFPKRCWFSDKDFKLHSITHFFI